MHHIDSHRSRQLTPIVGLSYSPRVSTATMGWTCGDGKERAEREREREREREKRERKKEREREGEKREREREMNKTRET